uniref:Protein kinase domain-containing protein n=1 Tax=Aegilops tauschii subsp. strangulata TaxID=200361 RepID=A0A453TAI6_AEGTS
QGVLRKTKQGSLLKMWPERGGYLAPECYNKEIILTHKFDLYSLGVIMIEILTGKKGCQV